MKSTSPKVVGVPVTAMRATPLPASSVTSPAATDRPSEPSPDSVGVTVSFSPPTARE